MNGNVERLCMRERRKVHYNFIVIIKLVLLHFALFFVHEEFSFGVAVQIKFEAFKVSTTNWRSLS